MIIGLEEYLAQAGIPILPVVGAIFVACVLLFRRGIVGEAARLLPRQ